MHLGVVDDINHRSRHPRKVVTGDLNVLKESYAPRGFLSLRCKSVSRNGISGQNENGYELVNKEAKCLKV